MERFSQLTGLAAPLPEANVDTDIIFPARFLLITAKTGLGQYAFHEWRHRPDGSPNADFVLNQPRFAGAPILVTGDNFGCGSSREQAPWALRDLGVRCIISTSFGEIFQANCFKNGMLPITLAPDQVARLMADADAGSPITVDLERQSIRGASEPAISFEVEGWRRQALLNGWDEIAVITREQGARIAAFEQKQRAQTPWLYTGD
jgi:3-isopropylmalate/(R)-2-methylmalate dehydratase small subunit